MTLAHVPLGGTPGDRVRTMVVDDSAVVRGFISRTLESDPRIEIVASAQNGQMAITQATRHQPDVIILDVEMPVMDGLTALPLLCAACPDAKIVMSSTLTQRGAEISLEAMARGASDYIPKPVASNLARAEDYNRELLDKVLGLGKHARHIRALERAECKHHPAQTWQSIDKSAPIVLRKVPFVRPKILAIGSSTGGPQALISLVSALTPQLDVPIVIVQHMPATFTTVLAQHLGRASGRPCVEASVGEPIRPGHIYVAPGDYHFELMGHSDMAIARLTHEPPENYCRPSVNPLFRSTARIFGPAALGVVLTGMGCDGLEGARQLAAANAPLIAQDEATSVVWGMPGAVATAGLCSAVLPLGEVSHAINAFFGGGKK